MDRSRLALSGQAGPEQYGFGTRRRKNRLVGSFGGVADAGAKRMEGAKDVSVTAEESRHDRAQKGHDHQQNNH
jgi:hypothetical protein